MQSTTGTAGSLSACSAQAGSVWGEAVQQGPSKNQEALIQFLIGEGSAEADIHG